MSFQRFPINVFGGSYESRSKPLSSQYTQNLIPFAVDQGKERFVLHQYWGSKEFGDSGVVKADRGAHQMAEEAYRVLGETLYKVNQFGTHTSLGTVAGTERCIFDDDGENLFICNGAGAVYQYDGSTVSLLGDSSLQDVHSVSFLNNRLIYTSNSFFKQSNVGDGSTISGLNIAGAESAPDSIVRGYAYQQQFYAFGKRTVEPFYDSGSGNPTLQRIDTQIFEVGLAARHSVSSTDRFMYWLGDDKRVYRATGGVFEAVSNDAISQAINDMNVIDDAIGYCYNMEGVNCYKLTFPTEDITFDLVEDFGKNGWFNTSHSVGGGRYKHSSSIYCYNKNLMFHESDGKVYYLDRDTFKNGTETIEYVRTMSSINSKLFGQTGDRVQMKKMRFNLDAGNGLISGQGENPRIRIEYSVDGGRSFDEGTWLRTGRLGEYELVCDWNKNKKFYDLIPRLSWTDPVKISLYSASIDLRKAGY